MTAPELSREERRRHGVYYTPAAIAGYMVRRCLELLLAERDNVLMAATSPPRILDPACGDGAFLRAAFPILIEKDQSATRTSAASPPPLPPNRLIQIARQLYGVDRDPTAIKSLRAAFAREFADSGPTALDQQTLVQNLRIGDALTGVGFEPSDAAPETDAIHWGQAFPEVAEAGGFDVILANPPYRRERSAREDFQRLGTSPLGRRWRQARMDLWFYFLHRALDLLRPGGVLAFLVNSYWTASTGAAKLIQRIEAETTPLEFVILEDTPLFRGVTGRHMIMLLRKGRFETPCRIARWIGRDPRDLHRSETWNSLLASTDTTSDCPPTSSSFTIEMRPRSALFQQGRLHLVVASAATDWWQGCRRLDEFYEVRQGIAENPPFVTREHVRLFPGRYVVGEGVFVLRERDMERLRFSPQELSLLRPYYEAAALGRYSVPFETTDRLLYLTRTTAPEIESLPNIAAHLERFRPLLERRRETREGNNRWWQLHWPREERLFIAPRILCVQMGREPQFVYAMHSTFVGFAVNVILPRHEGAAPLPVLTAILNSRLAAEWFEQNAKHRGVRLEINGGVLRRIPLAPRNPEIEDRLAMLVQERQKLPRTAADSDDATKLEDEIERLVRSLYGLDMCGDDGSQREKPYVEETEFPPEEIS